MTDSAKHIVVCDLGRIDYEPAWELQKALQARLARAKREEPSLRLPNVLLLVEHPHVYTLGKSGEARHLLLNDEALAARGATFVQVDRGGDITYHGPGQIVAYPILDLDRFYTDIHRYLRELEEAVIRTCSDYGLVAGRVEGRTGVWIGPDERGPERKICAMGIRCSRWVTMHGLALNVATDLAYFGYIVPCGIRDRGVTSLAEELAREVDRNEVTTRLLHHLSSILGASTSILAREEAQAFLDAFLASDAIPSPGA